MDQKKLHILSLLAALTAATIFGMSFMFSKMALATAAPTVLLAFRFTVAVAAMSLVIALNALVGKVRGKPLFAFSLKGKPVGKLLLLGIVQPVAYFIFENYGILYTSAAVAGTIIAAVPVCCILMDVLVLHERVTRRQVLCALGAIGGVALISVGGAVMISALGLLFLLLTMLSDTVYYGLSHDAAKRFTPFEMTYVMFVVGMAAFIPSKDEERNNQVLDKVKADKSLEANNGHDGTWIAHPGLADTAMAVFNDILGSRKNQLEVMREQDAPITADQLLAPCDGERTEEGMRANIRVAVQYIEAWISGNGCVPIYGLMEDAATAEISRTSIWQWIHHQKTLSNGKPVTKALFRQMLGEEMKVIASELGEERFSHGRFDDAARLMEQITTSDELIDFLTLPGYRLLA